MARFAIASVMLVAGAAAMLGPAHGQGVQHQFTPPPPIVALPSAASPSYPPVPGVAVPEPAPGRSHLAPYRVRSAPVPSGSRSTRNVYTSHGRAIGVPSAPAGQETFGDRVSNCAHAGASAGLGPNQLGGFMGRCVN